MKLYQGPAAARRGGARRLLRLALAATLLAGLAACTDIDFGDQHTDHLPKPDPALVKPPAHLKNGGDA